MNGDRPGTCRTYFEQVMTDPDILSAGGGTVCVFSTRCPTKTSANEDAAAVFPLDDHAAVLLVADGLGGGPAGEQAARLAVDALRCSLQEARAGQEHWRTAIITGFERANDDVQALGIGAATTLAVVEIGQGLARPYYVGDSVILVVSGRGRVKLQTVPHSPVGYGIEAGLIDADEAMHHEHRHIVSNVIGSPGMHIAIGPPVRLTRRDTVLVASDGLFDNLYSDFIAQGICKGKLLAAAQRLVAESLERMQQPAEGHPSKPDDLTLIAYRPQSTA